MGKVKTKVQSIALKAIVQASLAQLPWYHHLALLECLKSRGDRITYIVLAIGKARAVA